MKVGFAADPIFVHGFAIALPFTSLLFFQSGNIIAKPITKPIPIKRLPTRKLFDFILKMHYTKDDI